MKEGTKKNKAVFLDRDGVINRETGNYVFVPEDFDLNEGITDALAMLRDRGFLFIVISNQGGIARGLYTHSHVHIIHKILKKRLSAQSIKLTEIYYCPHYPAAGRCLCRKPESILLEKAISRFNIDPSLSWMIGDKESDVEAARRSGVKGILVKSNDSLMNYMNIIIPRQ